MIYPRLGLAQYCTTTNTTFLPLVLSFYFSVCTKNVECCEHFLLCLLQQVMILNFSVDFEINIVFWF